MLKNVDFQVHFAKYAYARADTGREYVAFWMDICYFYNRTNIML